MVVSARAASPSLPSTELLRTLLQTTPAAACLTRSGDSRFLDANDEMLRMLGYERDELVGRTAQELGVWREPPHEDARRALASEGRARGVALTFHTRTGEARQCAASLDVVQVEGEACVLATCVDVTDLTREAARVRDDAERFRRAFEDAPHGMALYDSKGVYLRVNRALCSMLGRDESELIGHDWKDFTHPDDVAPVTTSSERAIRSGGTLAGPITVEKRYLRKDGAIMWGSITSSAVRDPEGRILQFVTQVQDITERKLAEEAAKSQLMARAMVRRLLVGIIHRAQVPEAVVREVGREIAREASASSIQEALEAFRSLGFGELRLEKAEGRIFTFRGNDLLERRRQSAHPTCYLTLSYLEGTLAHLYDAPTLGTETQCQSKGHDRCVFVLSRRDAR